MAAESGLKQSLLNMFFWGPAHPTGGDVWVRIDRSQNSTEPIQLQTHPLYGVKGWAAALLIWLIASSALSVVITYSYWYQVKLMNPRAFIQLKGHYEFDLATAWFLFGWGCMNVYWLWTKDRMFRMSFFYSLLSTIGLSVMSSLSLGGDIAAQGILRSLIMAFIFIIPLSYVFRSKRISVTCDDMLRHDDPFLISPQEQNYKRTQDKTTNEPVNVGSNTEQESGTNLDDSDIELYEQVWEELDSGEKDKGLWAKAFAESGGANEKTKAIYIDLRVQQLEIQREEKLAELLRKKEQPKAEKKERERKERMRVFQEKERKAQERSNLIVKILVALFAIVVVLLFINKNISGD